jgi:hypothetical protein
MSVFGNIKSFVERHPYGTAAGVFLVGTAVIYYYYSGSSSTAAAGGASTNTATAIAANAQLAGQQLAAQGQIDLANIAAGVQTNQTNDLLTIGEEDIAAQLAQNTNNNATTVSLANIQQQESALNTSATVSLANIAGDVQENANNLAANLATTQSQLNANNQLSQINANTNIESQLISRVG